MNKILQFLAVKEKKNGYMDAQIYKSVINILGTLATHKGGRMQMVHARGPYHTSKQFLQVLVTHMIQDWI